MKTKLVVLFLVVAALFVGGAAVYVHASSGVSSTELSMSSAPESTPLACGNEGCSKKAECDKPAEDCPKAKEGCPKSGEGCPKSGEGCPKSKEGCPKSE